jgi:hypothetical protein
MGHRLQQFLPFGRIIDLGEFLRQLQVQVIPADDAILDEPFAGFGHLLVFLLRLQEFAWIADRDRAPMMAQSVKEPFDSPDWIFEIKLDGYRAVTVFDADGKPRLWSRNGLPLEQKFPAISKAVSRSNCVSPFSTARLLPSMKTAFLGFNCCKDSRSNPQLRRSTSYLTCSGPTGRTSPERLSRNVERCWKPLSNRQPMRGYFRYPFCYRRARCAPNKTASPGVISSLHAVFSSSSGCQWDYYR